MVLVLGAGLLGVEAPHPVATGLAGFFGVGVEAPHPDETGLAGFFGVGVEAPHPVDTELRPELPFALSSWPLARADSPEVFLPLPAAGFHPPPPDAPQPDETVGRDGFLSPVTFPEPAPQPVLTGRRVPAFPTVMGGSLCLRGNGGV